jgi:uncharacterized protein YbaR (Trm112 family)
MGTIGASSWSFFLAAAVPLAVGALAYGSIRKVAPWVVAVGVAGVGAALSGTVTFVYSDKCHVSHRIRAEIPRLLTSDEIASLKSEDWLCPEVYTFTRQGRPACLSAIGGTIGVGQCG